MFIHLANVEQRHSCSEMVAHMLPQLECVSKEIKMNAILYATMTIIFAVASYYNATDIVTDNYFISATLGMGVGYSITKFFQEVLG